MVQASLLLPVGVVLVQASGVAVGQSTTRASLSTAGAEGNGASQEYSISPDGRFVAFYSEANNLVPGDTNSRWDAFLRDRQTGTTERLSVDSAGAQSNGPSYFPSISADARFAAFQSSATNLIAGDTNGSDDVFLRDRQNGITARISIGTGGTEGTGHSYTPMISADSRFVAFRSDAPDLVAADTNGRSDIFVHDIQGGTTERVSIASGGTEGNGHSYTPSISADGRFVAFRSLATNLVLGDTNNRSDVFVHDRLFGTTERASVSSGGAQAGDVSGIIDVALSADGRFVAFDSSASNLVAGDTDGFRDVFVHDRQSGVTERVSVNALGAQGNWTSGYLAIAISADGRFVAFESFARNLVAGDSNGYWDVFVRDRQGGTTERVSVNSAGLEVPSSSLGASLSADGRFVTFWSSSSTVVAGDTNGSLDVFVRDRGTGVPSTDLCQPGSGGVAACPCNNPPAHAPRGCDNSGATGGAQLASSGSASLSGDSLRFFTNGERWTATSFVLQGDTAVANGFVIGQGVSCAGGSLVRLFVKTASAGSITAPGTGDASVSARSASLGDSIGAGTSRWYAVYYRDPVVLGGCAAASTFNVTQTQLVSWTP